MKIKHRQWEPKTEKQFFKN